MTDPVTDCVTGPGNYCRESAFPFACQGEQLIGFIHCSREPCNIGLLVIVPGGPQYRGGVGRQLVRLGRRLAEEGMPVMRFDHRGLGDGSGEFLGFRSIREDIAAAIAEFKARMPGLKRIILWGGCDAASAALIHGHHFDEVVAVIAGNPFVGAAEITAKETGRHYARRLLETSFWIKLARLRYNPADYVRALRGKIFSAANASSKVENSQKKATLSDELLRGLRQFDGKILFLMGDRFVASNAFDELVESTLQWRTAFNNPQFQRIRIVGGDQVFSSRDAQDQMFAVASDWLKQTFPQQLRAPLRPTILVPAA